MYAFFEEIPVNDESQLLGKFRNIGLERQAALDIGVQYLGGMGRSGRRADTVCCCTSSTLSGKWNRFPRECLVVGIIVTLRIRLGGRRLGDTCRIRCLRGDNLHFSNGRAIETDLGQVPGPCYEAAAMGSRETKDTYLKETECAVAYSATVLQNLAKVASLVPGTAQWSFLREMVAASSPSRSIEAGSDSSFCS